MQVRPLRVRVSRRPHKTDDIPPLDPHALAQALGVAIEMSVVIAIGGLIVEFVNGVASRLAEEELADGAGHGGMDRRSPRGGKVQRVMRVPEMNFGERIAKAGRG